MEHAKILDTLPLAALDESETLLCQGALTEKELNEHDEHDEHDEHGP